MPKRKLTDTVRTNLRMRETLRKQIEDAARANDSSMNAEMIVRLERSFETENQAEILEAINALRSEIRALARGEPTDIAALLREAADTLSSKQDET